MVQSVDITKPLYNVLARDACRATTAVPVFFPPASFAKVSDDGSGREIKRFNVIDGGIAVNDPVGFSSSHFLQFLLPTNIRHSQKLLLSCINASILRI